MPDNTAPTHAFTVYVEKIEPNSGTTFSMNCSPFCGRRTGALVLGDEILLGAVAMEDLDFNPLV
jgi:hypothetical protein